MPSPASAFIRSAGLHLAKLEDKSRKDSKKIQNISPNRSAIPEEVCRLGNYINRAVNSHKELNQNTAPQQGIAAPLIMLAIMLSQVRLTDSHVSATSPASENSALESSRDLAPSVFRSNAHPDNSGNSFSSALSPVANALYETAQFIAWYDPLMFPTADAAPVFSMSTLEKNRLPETQENTASSISPHSYASHITNLDKKDSNFTKKIEWTNFIDSGKRALDKFYDNHEPITPPLKYLARKILIEKIKEQFHLEIDPDKFIFILFNEVLYESGEKIQYAPKMKNTLTGFLFSNFDVSMQDNLVDMDAMCGIYSSALENNIEYNYRDAISITPTQFIKLVWDIDFYNYAKENTKNSLNKNKDKDIKKHFIDAINNLHVSGIESARANDILKGVGILGNTNIGVTLFDINGYDSENAFVFKNNDSGHVTLYLPQSYFKFISFRGYYDMQAWVTNACNSKKNRDMIAAHFTIANRQDGIFYSGVDEWLKTINENNDYYDRVAINSTPVSSDVFFDYMYEKIKYKTLSDLDSLVKSNAEIRRDMWEEMIDTSNIIPNPISPFLSLAIHIEHAISADTFEEKQDEWNKIKDDAFNLATIVLMDSAMKFPDMEGYGFVDKVKSGIASGDIENIIFLNEEEVELQGKNRKTKDNAKNEHLDEDDMVYEPENGCYRVKRGIGSSKVCPEWQDPGFNIEPDMGILDEYISRAISAEKTSMHFINIKGNIYRGHEDNYLYLKYKGAYFKLEKKDDMTLSVFIRKPEGAPSGSRGSNLIRLTDVVHSHYDINGVIPLEGTKAHERFLIAKKELGDNKLLKPSPLFNSIMESNLDKGLPVTNEKSILPVDGLPGVFSRRGSREYYIRWKDHFFRINFDHSKGTLSIYSENIKRKNLITEVITNEYGDIYPATDKGREEMRIIDIMHSFLISRAAAEFYLSQKDILLASDLSYYERSSINGYGRVDCYAINGFLNADMPNPYIADWMRKALVENISFIRSGLKKIPPYEGLVYRGGPLEKQKLDSLSPGRVVSNKAFMSTSADREVAILYSHGYNGFFFKMKIRNSGHPISMFTGKHDEAEVLIEDHQYFVVKNIDKNLREIELEEVAESSLSQAEKESLIYI
ncbi:DUF6543 domain-containing protein [Pseudomonas chlororaphis]|uniref:dermonecrotic toxin domain-containing protein n=1 Tax=Pseudomonas chlororaphis TaxID=587753 RepID=UPI0030CB2CCB